MSMYENLGVDPHKTVVKKAFADLTDSIYNGTFCVVRNDRHIPGNVCTKHVDGSGSKSAVRVLYFLETGDFKIFKEDPYDALSMNTSDIGACGFVYDVEMTDVVAINEPKIGKGLKKIILEQYAAGFRELIDLYANYGIMIDFFGGETADLIDQTNSIIIDVDVRSTMPRKLLIRGNIKPGDIIFGFSSAGKAIWEKEINSGIMSNGLTLGSRTLLHPGYLKKYPFLFNPEKPLKGRYALEDFDPYLGMTIGKALLSPTRQWAIVIRMLIDELRAQDALHLLHGICINTGGGLTKCLNLGNGIIYDKIIPEPSPLSQLIQSESGETWENMCVTFNCGVGIEIIGSEEGNMLLNSVQIVAEKTEMCCFPLGECHSSKSGKNEVILDTEYGTYTYPKK